MQKKQAETLDNVLDQYLKALGLDKKIKEMRNMEGYMADIESDMDYQNTKNDRQKYGGTFSGYTSRSGYIYGRYY